MQERIDIVTVQMVRNGFIPYGHRQICGPKDLADLGQRLLKNADREMFLLVCLSIKNYVNCIHLVSIGTLGQSIVSGREILKTALLSNSAYIAFIHNHPSGFPEPSREDIETTRKLSQCAALFDIKVLDHVIVADENKYESLAERGVIDAPRVSAMSKELREQSSSCQPDVRNATECRNCGNAFKIRWIKRSRDYVDSGHRYCPFCGLLTQKRQRR